MSHGPGPVVTYGTTDFDHLSRSEARVTRRIGGGRQQLWMNGQWVAYTPAPKPHPEPAATPDRSHPDGTSCANGHANPEWYVNPKTGWRHCRVCRRKGRKPRV